ncbi:DUF3289 family protein [Brenneria sp. 4F2]|nr:DUF3289 family protein [Brenneria bubanii]
MIDHMRYGNGATFPSPLLDQALREQLIEDLSKDSTVLVNGMGITIHDIGSAHITLKSLHIGDNNFHAVMHYRVQDHFGLDNEDILKWLFRQFRFFKIWFVLQHYGPLAQRPFITEMDTEVEITGMRR